MKKIALLLITAVLLFVCASSALATVIDLSAFEANEKLYTVDFNSAGTSAFVESSLSAKSRSFTHKYENTNLYSTTKFDILVVNYNKADNYPVFRLWVTYCADNAFLNIDSVTFQIGKKQFTFTDITDEDWLTYNNENGYIEEVLIRFSSDTLDFLLALEEAIKGKSTSVEELDTVEVKMILHGDEEIVVELDSGFLLDFMGMKQAWLDMDGLNYLDEILGSDMSVTTIY